eukprot:5531295-Pleurochrysis_carterae.AAC.1
MLYHGKVLALAYVFTSIPRPDRMPGSLPPSPPASEQSETEQQPSQPRVGSARVTRSQTRAREAAGLPSLLVGLSTSTPCSTYPTSCTLMKLAGYRSSLGLPHLQHLSR